MTFRMALNLIAGIETGEAANILMEEFSKLVCGTLSLPINLPGTNYRRAFKAISLSLSLSLSVPPLGCEIQHQIFIFIGRQERK